MTEQELLEVASRLGRHAVAGLDPDRVARAVADGARRRLIRFRALGLVGLAAAAALVLAVGPRLLRGPAHGTPEVITAPGVLHELDDLTVTQLEVVLRSIPPAETSPGIIQEVPLGDLSVEDLERLLQSMEE